MRNENKAFIDWAMSEISKEKVVLDAGGGERFTKWMKEYEPLFKNCDYKTLDYDASTNPDVVGDIHKLPLRDGSIDAIICSSVLEHVENPVVAMKEMYRVLRPGGKIFVYVPSIYPYHARKGAYPDYWRFFDDTVKMLFRNFNYVDIQKVGGYFKALMFFLPMQHRLRGLIDPTARLLDGLFKTKSRNTTSGFLVYATK